ncbi:MAG: hypothetical protein DI609_12425 [Corynebacterium urealyticum]|uniref:Uncharacterized protein n=1 Tax=Corynebacterium urealyticum TaxID=43771 RepID=A0A2W5AWQ6_9CORY|nr:MAG: hypothetical protein DI609_12425 [Corynebacterium urealyticum]
MKTIELFTTTVDAVGMDTDISGPAIALLIPVLWCTLLFLVCAYLELIEKTASTARKVVLALGIVVVPALWTPYVVADFGYSKDALHRMVKVPAHDAHSSFRLTERAAPTPGPENKTVVAAVHDKFQDELDQHRDTLDKMGLGEQCEILRELNEDPNAVSVLCGGYLVKPVIARGMELTPVVNTSADQAWWPWSVDPHNVEVTARIEIDKE